MAVIVYAEDPEALWAAIKLGIERDEIRTWEFDAAKKYITHRAAQWTKKAWLLPAVGDGTLTFNIVKPKNANITVDVYAEYHALLIRMLLANFDKMCSRSIATSLPAAGDNVAA